jgi:CubicO group peptidase (beta-lactamase class C family)
MKILQIIILCLIPNLLAAQVDWLDSLDNYIATKIVDCNIPSLAIGIVKDNDVIFQNGYGVNILDSDSKTSTETIFPIGSCTKSFTAACIGILVDEGKLRWDDKVIKYFPDFKLSDPWVTKELTISDLLSHRSGLRKYEGDELWYGTNYSREEIVKKMQYYPIINDFRIEFGYQNVMYLVAGTIIEEITGQTWDDFVKKKIFTPLFMDNSSTSISQFQQSENYAKPYLGNHQISLLNMDNIGPAGSINSNVNDMLNWLKLWINEGEWNGNIIVSKDAYQAMTNPKIITSRKSDKGYGFGWNIETDDCEKVIHHGGFMPGSKSSVFIMPERNIGIVILTNQPAQFLNEEIIGLVIKELLDKDKTNWENAISKVSYACGLNLSWDKEREEMEKLNSILPSDHLKYIGIYKDSIYGEAEISLKNGQLFLELIPTKDLFSGNMYFLNNDTFAIAFNDRFIKPGKVIFMKDSLNKKVSNFKLDVRSTDFHFKDLHFEKIK